MPRQVIGRKRTFVGRFTDQTPPGHHQTNLTHLSGGDGFELLADL